MIIQHAGKRPEIDSTASIAPDATVCGTVQIGPGARVLYGARIIGENGGIIKIGRDCIVMENAVVRATAKHSCIVGDNCLIGPNAHVVGATLEREVFVATAAAIFHGAVLGHGAEVRPHATVHLRTHLPAGSTVPIGWVAVGNPAQILSPDRHDEIWAVQKLLNFPEWVYGYTRETPELMCNITHSLSKALTSHTADSVIEDHRYK
jgi:carbonic anhydrase/acetyltransferase-like protein (isoleucine patch superfamily)